MNVPIMHQHCGPSRCATASMHTCLERMGLRVGMHRRLVTEHVLVQECTGVCRATMSLRTPACTDLLVASLGGSSLGMSAAPGISCPRVHGRASDEATWVCCVRHHSVKQRSRRGHVGGSLPLSEASVIPTARAAACRLGYIPMPHVRRLVGRNAPYVMCTTASPTQHISRFGYRWRPTLSDRRGHTCHWPCSRETAAQKSVCSGGTPLGGAYFMAQ